MIVTTTATTAWIIAGGIAPAPPTRSIAPRSEKPIRMNTKASSTKENICQNEVPRIRSAAVQKVCWYQPSTRPAATTAMTETK